MNKTTSQAGFSLVEVLVTTALVGILAGIAMMTYNSYRNRAFDAMAQSDYRNLIVGVKELLNSETPPRRVSIRARSGPGALPSPLTHVTLSTGVTTTVLFTYTPRANQQPLINTTLDVQHERGTKRYRYVEVNGVVTETVTNR